MLTPAPIPLLVARATVDRRAGPARPGRVAFSACRMKRDVSREAEALCHIWPSTVHHFFIFPEFRYLIKIPEIP
jgi:hypothetical protein